MADHIVRPIVAGDLDTLKGVLGRAFEDDPLMGFVFAGKPDIARRIAELYQVFARLHIVHDGCLTTDDLAGAALWAPPGQWRLGIGTQLRLAPRLLRLFGPSVLKHAGDFNRLEAFHGTMPAEHWYLAVLGTDPIRQGTGVGAALMEPILERCDRDGHGAYLESSKESNLAFYSRFGFDVVEERSFTNGPSYWPMWRDPRPR